MILFCTNTKHGLVPNYDDDYDQKRKLKIGQVYKLKVTKARNYEFHKKYFALINCAWEYQTEEVTALFNQRIDSFRKTVEITAGHYEKVYSLSRKEWIEQPKSIAFDKMDEIAFQQLYESVKDVLFSTFLKNISEEEFMKNLVNF